MIINPYNINVSQETTGDIKNENNLIEEITQKILYSNREQIESNNKEALISEIEKQLSCTYCKNI